MLINSSLRALLAITICFNLHPAALSSQTRISNQPKKHAVTGYRRGIARDLVAAASEMEKAAAEIEAEQMQNVKSRKKSDQIEHENGNIPFEWRVQLIHKRMGQAWDHRNREQDDEKSGSRESNYDRGKEMANHGRTHERYRKKKIDILIEEWWNNEKWNRLWWDNHDHKDERYRGVKKNKYHGKGKGKRGGKGHGSNPVLVYVKRGGKKTPLKKKKPHGGAQSRRREVMARLDERPVCARINDGFCQVDPYYPEDIVSQLINANVTRFRELIYSAQAQWESNGSRPVKEANSIGHSPTCAGDIREAVPLWAPNRDGKWKIIANTKKFKQKYLVQVCTQQTLDCASIHNLTCKEQYGRLPFVALDLTSSQQLHVDWFAMPFACYCRPFTGL